MCLHLHCNMLCFPNSSDTVTRSGMFCALATVIDRCKTEGIVDVFQVVKALRTSKPGAVPTMVCCFHMTFIKPEAVFNLIGRFKAKAIIDHLPLASNTYNLSKICVPVKVASYI